MALKFQNQNHELFFPNKNKYKVIYTEDLLEHFLIILSADLKCPPIPSI